MTKQMESMQAQMMSFMQNMMKQMQDNQEMVLKGQYQILAGQGEMHSTLKTGQAEVKDIFVSVRSKQEEQEAKIGKLDTKVKAHTKQLVEINKTLGLLDSVTAKMQEQLEEVAMTRKELAEVDAAIKSLGESVKIINEKVENQDPIMQTVVADLAALQKAEEFDKSRLLAISKKIKGIEEKLKGEQPVTVVQVVSEIVYENELLNHPELFKAAVSKYGFSQALDLGSRLSTELINLAASQTNEDIVLAGLMSVENNAD